MTPRIRMLLLVLFGAALLSSCSGQDQQEERQETSQVQEKTREKTQTGERSNASGRGSDSLTLTMTPGSATFSYGYVDEGQFPGFFAVDLLDGQGRPAAAAKLIALRERFEGRRLADEEYGLIVITRSEGVGKISPWSDENHVPIHAYVMAERVTLW